MEIAWLIFTVIALLGTGYFLTSALDKGENVPLLVENNGWNYALSVLLFSLLVMGGVKIYYGQKNNYEMVA